MCRHAQRRTLVTRHRPTSAQAPRGFRADLIDDVCPNLQSLLGPLKAAGKRHEEAKTHLNQLVSREKVAARRAEATEKANAAAEAEKARTANATTGKGKKRAGGAGS
jgi:conjugal transfer/entry exclusion protein